MIHIKPHILLDKLLPYNKHSINLQTFPIVITQYKNQNYLIDGYLRYQFAQKHGIEIIQRKISCNSLEEIFQAVISSNCTREFNIIEKSHLLCFAENNNLENANITLAPILKSKINDETRKQASQVIQLPMFYQSILQNQKVTFRQLLSLLVFDGEQLNDLQEILEQCRYSQTNFYLFFSHVYQFIRLKDITLKDFLKQEFVRKILEQDIAPYEKGESLLHQLLQKIKPEFYQSSTEANLIKRKLKGIFDISYNANFEDDYFRITAKVSKETDLEEIIKALSDSRTLLNKLLEIIHGDD